MTYIARLSTNQIANILYASDNKYLRSNKFSVVG